MLLDKIMETEKTDTDVDSDLESSEEDEYEANIEFSNACRHYYLSRLEATESFKKDMKREDTGKIAVSPNQRKRSTIDEKMEKLRTEMASLMDQDVSLMKQLLTLNEMINEIKQGRLSSSSKGSIGSRGFVSGSDWSVVSESEMSVSTEQKIFPKIEGFVINPLNVENSIGKVKTAEKTCNKEIVEKINPLDLWKVRTQISLTSNDSGFAEEPTNLLQTEV